MKYLDYSKLPAFRARHFPDVGRRVGRTGEHVSDYAGIERFFSPGSVDPGEVKVRYHNQPFKIEDPLLADYAAEIAGAMRAKNRLHDGPAVMKLARCDLKGRPPVIIVQPVDYALQAGICFALDRPRVFCHI